MSEQQEFLDALKTGNDAGYRYGYRAGVIAERARCAALCREPRQFNFEFQAVADSILAAIEAEPLERQQ